MDEKTDDNRILPDCEQNSPHLSINFSNGIWFNKNYSRILDTKTDDHRILQDCDQNSGHIMNRNGNLFQFKL